MASPHAYQIHGTLNAGALSIGGEDYVDLGSTGVITVTGDVVSDLNTYWIPLGLFTASSGYNVVGSYDSNTGKSTITTAAVPEPAGMALLACGSLFVMARRR